MSLSKCGADPLATARQLRQADPAQRIVALDCYELFGGNDPSAHYEAASLAYELNQPVRLKRALQAAVRLAPFFGDGHFEIGNVLSGEGRIAEAVASYRRALDDQQLSDRPMTLNNLGNSLSDLGDYEGAMQIFQRGLKLAPTFVYLNNGLANALTSQNKYDEAVAILEQGLQHEPGAHYLSYTLGSALRKLKRWDASEAAFRDALAAAPNDWRYLQGAGQLYHERGRPEDAVSYYGRAMDVLRTNEQPRSAALERDRAAALRETKRLDEAEAAARAAIDLAPNEPESFKTLADVLQEAKRHEERAQVMQREAEAEVFTRASAAPAQERAAARAAVDAARADLAARTSGPGGRARRVVIFCRPSYSGERADDPKSWAWGPRAKERGIGGSESAVIAVSRELVRAGWVVEVYASPPAEDVGVDDGGVHWLPHWAYDTLDGGIDHGSDGIGGGGAKSGGMEDVDVFVAWRFAEALYVGRRAQRRYLWLHDEVMNGTVPKVALPLLADGGGGVFVLSAFHRSQLPPHALPHALLTSNGLEDAAMADGDNENDRFLYASTPSAGLHLLLTMWAQIRSAIPTAKLDVYYGFWPYAMWNEQKHLIAMRKLIEPLLEQVRDLAPIPSPSPDPLSDRLRPPLPLSGRHRPWTAIPDLLQPSLAFSDLVQLVPARRSLV